MDVRKFNNDAPNIMLGTLTHNGQLEGRMARSFYVNSSERHNVYFMPIPTSLLASGYNQLWCTALNKREEMGWRYLAILHADIIPEDFWIDKLVQLAELNDADVMSAIVPIKDATGVTSTAISRPGGDTFSCYARLTQMQINDPEMPSTFDIDTLYRVMNDEPYKGKLKSPLSVPEGCRLLVNTGCCVIRLDREWSHHAHFTINDRIVGRLGALSYEVEPEDWYFSRIVAEMGGRVMATREVTVRHVGTFEYHSNQIWGYPYDTQSLNR